MISDEEFKVLAEKYFAELRERTKDCQHEGYTFEKDGRCCPHCLAIMIDFGD